MKVLDESVTFLTLDSYSETPGLGLVLTSVPKNDLPTTLVSLKAKKVGHFRQFDAPTGLYNLRALPLEL